MRFHAVVVPLLCVAVLLPLGAGAVEMLTSVVASGGERSSSTNYVHLGTLGQSSIGVVAGPSNIHGIGFWYFTLSWPTSGMADPFGTMPVRFWLGRNYPNPFNPITTLEYSVPEPSHVAIKLFDVNGREVKTLVDAEKVPGYHKVTFQASGLSSGIYFCRMVTSTFVQTRTVALVK